MQLMLVVVTMEGGSQHTPNDSVLSETAETALSLFTNQKEVCILPANGRPNMTAKMFLSKGPEGKRPREAQCDRDCHVGLATASLQSFKLSLLLGEALKEIGLVIAACQ